MWKEVFLRRIKFGIIFLSLCGMAIMGLMFLFPRSAVYASDMNKDTLYSVYSAVKIGMTVDEVRNIVKRLSPQDVREIPEALEPSGDSTSGTFDVRISHVTRKSDEYAGSRLTLLFASEGYGSSLVLVSARWEKIMRNGSSLEYSKKKGR